MPVPSAAGLCFLRQRGREEVAAQAAPVGLVDPALVRVPYEVVVAVSPLGYSSGLLPPHLFVARNRPITAVGSEPEWSGRGGSVRWMIAAVAPEEQYIGTTQGAEGEHKGQELASEGNYHSDSDCPTSNRQQTGSLGRVSSRR